MTREKLNSTSAAMHSEPRPVPHCRVLPPGEFNGTILEPLDVYCKSFMKTA